MTPPDDDTVRCRRCMRVRPGPELDRILWCEECVAAELARAAWWGRGLAFLGAGLLALRIALVIRPGDRFLFLWAIVIVIAFALGARLGRELVYGIVRVQNRPRARALGPNGGA